METAPARRNQGNATNRAQQENNAAVVRIFRSLKAGKVLRTGIVRAPNAPRNVRNKVDPNTARSAFKTGNNPARNPARRNQRTATDPRAQRVTHAATVRNFRSLVTGDALRTATVRAPNASRKACHSRSLGNSKRNHSRVRHCRTARPAMPNQNQHVRNLAAKIFRLAPVAQ